MGCVTCILFLQKETREEFNEWEFPLLAIRSTIERNFLNKIKIPMNCHSIR
jgi:hypothetical protein